MTLSLGPEASISLDSPGRDVFFSHAHSDHLTSRVQRVLASKQTLGLMKARGWTKPLVELDHSAYSEQGVSIKLLESGHVLGSRQLWAQLDGQSFTYTADLNPEGTLLCKPAEIPVGVDSLLVESTYGKPEYAFPPAQQVYTEISSWVDNSLKTGHSVVLGGYALGKAQELVKVLNTHCGLSPIVNDSVASVCREYNKFGAGLKYIESSSPEGQASLKHSFVAVLPHHQVQPGLSEQLEGFCGRKVLTSLATGWANGTGRLSGVNKAFVLSSHADFASLIRFVEATGPKKVYCNHGFAQEFSSELRKRGYDAVAVEKHAAARSLKVVTALPAE
jgi:putative mRNA 3-end processing factor